MLNFFRDGGWAVPLGSRLGVTSYTSLNCKNPTLTAWLQQLENIRQGLCLLIGFRCEAYFVVHEKCEQVQINWNLGTNVPYIVTAS
jgi:hypothetical protein